MNNVCKDIFWMSSTGRINRVGGTYRGKGRACERPGFNKILVECFYCHFQYECPKKNKGKESQAHFAETSKPLLFVAYVEEKVERKEESTGCLSEIKAPEAVTTKELLLMAHVEKETEETAWFLDSSCNEHMCGYKEFFSELDEGFRKYVKLGDNSSIGVTGKGCIQLQVNNVSQVTLLPTILENLSHYWYGHLSFEGLKTIKHKQMVHG